MANTDIMIRAEARKLFQSTSDKRLENYKKMPTAELSKLIKAINSGAKGTAKGPAAKGAATKGAVKGASTKGVAKGAATKGTATKSAPAAKSTTQKSSTKGAAQGKAKRPASAGSKGKATTAKGAKGTAKTQPSVEPKRAGKIPKTYDGHTVMASNGRGRITSNPKRGESGYRAPLEYDKIDWDAPWNGGQRGSRAVVLAKLRETQGDIDATFKALKRRVDNLYANVTTDRIKHLRWHIARTAFDFAIGTGQHDPGTRVAPGESTNPGDVKRRKQRTPAKKRTTKNKKTTPASRKRGAVKGGRSAKRTTAKRSSTKRKRR